MSQSHICSVATRAQSDQGTTWTLWEGGYSQVQLHKMQVEDPYIGPILECKEMGHKTKPPDLKNFSAATRHYGYLWDSLVIKGNLLYKDSPESEGSEERTQIVVPLKLQSVVLKNLHSSVLAGHIGRKKAKSQISQRYYWFEMRETINIYLTQCDICEANKSPPKLHRAPLGDMPVGARLDRIATYLLGPLSR